LFLSTLEFQRAETKSIPFSSLKQRFQQLEERHALRGSVRQEGANAALLNPNPLAASNCQGGKHKGKPQQHGGSPKNYDLLVVLVVTLLVAMVNPSFASNVANLATRRLIVPQGRRGMVVL